MTDIVERLLRQYTDHGTNCVQEAADKIETLRQQLTAANERIRELEGALNDAVRAGDNAYQHMLKKEAQLTAEREVSGKLENALVKLLDNHTSLINAGECGSWNVEKESEVISARAAIAEVAAIRAALIKDVK